MRNSKRSCHFAGDLHRSGHRFVNRRPRIRVTFTTITEESAINGDWADSGYVNENGFPMDWYEGHTVVDDAIDFLRDHGVTQASSSHFHPGIWYSDEGQTDYHTGETEQRSYHLVDFTTAQQLEVFNRFTGVTP